MHVPRGRPAWLAGLAGAVACLAIAVGQSVGGDPPQIKEGQAAPDVELPAANVETALPDQKGAKTLRLKDFKGKKHVVLYFFPKAMTTG
jgi:hypothetical protein